MKNYVLVGDIHSQYHQLVSALNFIEKNIENYYVVFLGDLFDSRNSSSDSVNVFHTVKNLEKNKKCVVLKSNHQDKHIRYLKGHSVYLNNGLDKTIEDFQTESFDNSEILNWLDGFPYGLVFKDKYGTEYRCSHAYFSSKLYVPNDYEEEYLIYDVSKSTKKKCLYGIIQDNSRIEWWNNSTDRDWIRVAGHYHKVHIDLETTKSIVLDGECGDKNGKLYIYDVNNRKSYNF